MLYFNNKNLNELFDEFVGNTKNAFEGALLDSDIIENDEAYLVSINMPGVSKENVNMDFKDNTLYIDVKKDDTKKEKDLKYVLKERCEVYGKRSFTLGDVESENIKAKLDNGVLNVILPKKVKTKEEKKFITIE